MGSKYYNRAIEILGDELFTIDGELHIDNDDNTIIEAMCKLAEEVEATKILNTVTKEDIDKLSKSYENCVEMYTKEQVEELAIEFAKYLFSTEITKHTSMENPVKYTPSEFNLMKGNLIKNGEELFKLFLKERNKKE
jgi:hypothetical protein